MVTTRGGKIPNNFADVICTRACRVRRGNDLDMLAGSRIQVEVTHLCIDEEEAVLFHPDHAALALHLVALFPGNSKLV